MPHFLFLLLLFWNLADRSEKRKIDKEQRIEIKNLKRKKMNKKHVKGNICQSLTELRKKQHINKQAGKNKKANKNKT